MDHVAALAEALEITQPVIARVVLGYRENPRKVVLFLLKRKSKTTSFHCIAIQHDEIFLVTMQEAAVMVAVQTSHPIFWSQLLTHGAGK